MGDLTKLSITSESGTGILGECVVANILGIRNCDNCTLTKKSYDWSCPHDLEKDGIKIQVKAIYEDFKSNNIQINVASGYVRCR